MATERRDPRDPMVETEPDEQPNQSPKDPKDGRETPQERRVQDEYPSKDDVTDPDASEEGEELGDKVSTGNNARRIEDRQGGYGSSSGGGSG